ncbi:MAG TPA: phosphocarrier protein HPr [Firmicutes bacterium]|nr:phosphocarrier protein HPr [Bacillota bacterium]
MSEVTRGGILVKQTYLVVAKTGIHTSAAKVLVESASRHEADVFLVYRGKRVDAKSILGVMSLGIQPNASFELVVKGANVEGAMRAIKEKLVSEHICTLYEI